MTDEQVTGLFKAAHNVMNARDYLERIKSGESSFGGTVKEWENNLGFAEMQLNSILHELSPSREVHDTVVYTLDSKSDVIGVYNPNDSGSEQYLCVPHTEDTRINVRISIEEI